jgi:hypothetical protein
MSQDDDQIRALGDVKTKVEENSNKEQKDVQ